MGTPTPAPTVSLTASLTTIDAGESVTLTWTSTNAASCSAAGAWSGMLATSGSQSTGALNSDASYFLICSGPGGASQTATLAITVNALPTAQLTASPDAVALGRTASLAWNSTDALSCAASEGWSGTLAASGTQMSAPITATTLYSLVCTGAGGTSAPVVATVTLIPSPGVTLSASPSSVASAQAAILSWSTTIATSCTASGAWSGAKGVSGTQGTGPLTSAASYSLPCSGPGGTVRANATVNIIPTATLSVSPSVVAPGDTATLTWALNQCHCVHGQQRVERHAARQRHSTHKCGEHHHLLFVEPHG